MIQHFVSHSKCRLCDSGNIEQVIDLGYSPLANAYLTEAQLKDVRSGALEEIFTPLRCFLCMDCGSVQLEHSVDPKVLFTDYQYASSTSPVFVKHFEDLAKHVQELGLVKRCDLVVDIGSNDGILLKPFIALGGINAIGIEPSHTLAQIAQSRALATTEGFFDISMAKTLASCAGKAQIITATNVFAHVSDLPRFVEAVLELLDDDGVFIIEVSYLADVIENMLFDTIYVEHQFYHSVTPLVQFFDQFGLHIFRAERISTHGGSIRLFVKRGKIEPECISGWLDRERSRGLLERQVYRDFTDRIQAYKHRLHDMIKPYLGYGVFAYGAPAKLTTFCYALDLHDKFLYIVDDSPLKVDRFTPGDHAPIISRDAPVLAWPSVDYRHSLAVVSAWNFFDSIFEKNSKLARNWLRPLPRLEVLSA